MLDSSPRSKGTTSLILQIVSFPNVPKRPSTRTSTPFDNPTLESAVVGLRQTHSRSEEKRDENK